LDAVVQAAHNAQCARTAQELLLAVPMQLADIYEVHQRVWSEVSRAQAVDHRPTLLYRHDPGMIRVRISDCALRRGSMARPVRISLVKGDEVSLRTQLALWRNVPPHASRTKVMERVIELLSSAGLDVKLPTLDIGTSIGRGCKQRHGGCDIALPVATVHARVEVMDPGKAAEAWVHGLGRGRRFGFGMLDLTQTSFAH
jgi:hypothetical protein